MCACFILAWGFILAQGSNIKITFPLQTINFVTRAATVAVTNPFFVMKIEKNKHSSYHSKKISLSNPKIIRKNIFVEISYFLITMSDFRSDFPFQVYPPSIHACEGEALIKVVNKATTLLTHI